METDLVAAAGGSARNEIDAALYADAFQQFPTLGAEPFKSMLTGMRTDLSSDQLRSVLPLFELAPILTL